MQVNRRSAHSFNQIPDSGLPQTIAEFSHFIVAENRKGCQKILEEAAIKFLKFSCWNENELTPDETENLAKGLYFYFLSAVANAPDVSPSTSAINIQNKESLRELYKEYLEIIPKDVKTKLISYLQVIFPVGV